MHCRIARTTNPPTIDANWDKSPWDGIEPLPIDRPAGERTEHCPTALVKLAYDDAAVYAIFRVEDRYVRAVATEHNGPVWRDTCVEFFFTPGRDASMGYFNLEMNCGGTMLLQFQEAPQRNCDQLPTTQFAAIEIAHSLPKIINSEIVDPVTWIVEYRLPIAILDEYCRVERPAPQVVWRANFYKCGDATSHPHWLTWSPIEIRDFHRPQDFGILEFQ